MWYSRRTRLVGSERLCQRCRHTGLEDFIVVVSQEILVYQIENVLIYLLAWMCRNSSHIYMGIFRVIKLVVQLDRSLASLWLIWIYSVNNMPHLSFASGSYILRVIELSTTQRSLPRSWASGGRGRSSRWLVGRRRRCRICLIEHTRPCFLQINGLKRSFDLFVHFLFD